MGQLIEVREKIGAGNVDVVGNDIVEVEKNDNVVKDYTVANVTYVSASVSFGGAEFIGVIDIDTLSDVQLRAVMANPDYQVVKKYDRT